MEIDPMILRWLSRRCVRDNWHADHDAHPSAAPVASFLPWCRFQSVPKRLACAWSQDTGRETSSSARCTSRQSAHWSSASRYTMLVHLAGEGSTPESSPHIDLGPGGRDVGARRFRHGDRHEGVLL